MLRRIDTFSRRLQRTDQPIALAADLTLDVGVYAFAGLTVIYQIFLATQWPIGWSVVADVVWVVACIVVVPLLRRRVNHEQSRIVPRPDSLAAVGRRGGRMAVATGAAALAAATLFGAYHWVPWLLTWALWLAAALAGTGWALWRWKASRSPSDAEPTVRRTEPTHSLPALVFAAGAAVLSLFLVRPNPDDSHYVNISTWIAQHGGTFPLRDTLYSDLKFPALFWPPIDSYHELAGVLARLVHVQAPDVVYLFVPPVASFFAVLALWRLLRAWQVRPVWLALAGALVFLLWNATQSEQIGNYFVGRIWQGKMMLLCNILPLLFCYLQQYARRPSWRAAAMLLAVSVAGLGLSTSAMFIIPVIAVAGMVPLAFRSPLPAVLGFAAASVYPAAMGAVTVLLHGYVPNTYYTFQADPKFLAYYLQGAGPQGAIFVLAGLIGWLVIRHPLGRITTGAAASMLTILFAPGVAVGIFYVTGLSRTLSRLVWVTPVAALFGAAVAVAFSWAYPRRLRLLRYLLPAVILAAMIVSGRPIWSHDNGAYLASAPRWKWRPAEVNDAKAIVAHSEPGDNVLAPKVVSEFLPVLTSRVKVVNVRDYYTSSFVGVPGFHGKERWLLGHFARGQLQEATAKEVGHYLRLLHVTSACVKDYKLHEQAVLGSAGYRLGYRTPRLVCYVPASD